MTSPRKPWLLRWRDVDPSIVPFDPAAARQITEELLGHLPPAYRKAPSDEVAASSDPYAVILNPDLDELEDLVDGALVIVYGVWATGWRWTASEAGCGGPVQVHHKLGARDHDGVALALADWRGWLESIAQVFAAIDADTAGLSLEARIERAATRILPVVVERTGAKDAWYRAFATTLSWYIERLAPEHDPARWIREIVDVRFRSWTAPDPESAQETCAVVARSVSQALVQPLSTDDATDAWMRVRAEIDWPRLLYRTLPLTPIDGHMRYIDMRDRERDELRADRMHEALGQIRAAAQRGEPLTAELLARCQRTVLGLHDPPAFRTRDAYAKGGRERYAWAPQREHDFAQCLAEANGPASDALWCAARVYLDVCFYHPFDDGNARAARLAMDHVLSRAGLTLMVADPVFAFSRWADSRQDALSFGHLLVWVAGRRTGAA